MKTSIIIKTTLLSVLVGALSSCGSKAAPTSSSAMITSPLPLAKSSAYVAFSKYDENGVPLVDAPIVFKKNDTQVFPRGNQAQPDYDFVRIDDHRNEYMLGYYNIDSSVNADLPHSASIQMEVQLRKPLQVHQVYECDGNTYSDELKGRADCVIRLTLPDKGMAGRDGLGNRRKGTFFTPTGGLHCVFTVGELQFNRVDERPEQIEQFMFPSYSNQPDRTSDGSLIVDSNVVSVAFSCDDPKTNRNVILGYFTQGTTAIPTLDLP